MEKKSQLIGFILCFLFGPLGLFYVSVAAAIGMILMLFPLALIIPMFGILFVWPLSIILSFYLVAKFNKKVVREERRHLEMLNVASGMDVEKAKRNAYWQSKGGLINVPYVLLKKIFPERYKK